MTPQKKRADKKKKQLKHINEYNRQKVDIDRLFDQMKDYNLLCDVE